MTLTVDKSVQRVAAWVIATMIASISLSVMATALAFFAFMRAGDMRDQAESRFADMSERFRIAERESRVATERFNDIKVELAKRGIPLTDH